MDVHESLPKYPVFKWWAWWSMWQDVDVFHYAGGCHLLQCSRSRNGKAKFRVATMGSQLITLKMMNETRGQ